FVDYIISNFNHAVTCRKPTYFGIVLQGIFLVILFSIVDYLINENIL
nr:pB66L [African swine fever virus]